MGAACPGGGEGRKEGKERSLLSCYHPLALPAPGTLKRWQPAVTGTGGAERPAHLAGPRRGCRFHATRWQKHRLY